MADLATVAPAMVDIAHRIVWASVATVGPSGHVRTRVLHPIWEWDGEQLRGWVATGPTPLKRSHIEHQPRISLSYWDQNHDVVNVEAEASWIFDDDGRTTLWNRLKDAPPPLGYDPAIIPPWADGPLTPAFAGLALEPVRIRVMPASVLLAGTGEVLTWSR